jgi:hypothetical protein
MQVVVAVDLDHLEVQVVLAEAVREVQVIMQELRVLPT